jgi:hypothetical protein
MLITGSISIFSGLFFQPRSSVPEEFGYACYENDSPGMATAMRSNLLISVDRRRPACGAM